MYPTHFFLRHVSTILENNLLLSHHPREVVMCAHNFFFMEFNAEQVLFEGFSVYFLVMSD